MNFNNSHSRDVRRWRPKGGLLVLLAVASMAASSFSLFSNRAAFDRDRLLGDFSVFLVDDEDRPYQTALDELTRDLETGDVEDEKEEAMGRRPLQEWQPKEQKEADAGAEEEEEKGADGTTDAEEDVEEEEENIQEISDQEEEVLAPEPATGVRKAANEKATLATASDADHKEKAKPPAVSATKTVIEKDADLGAIKAQRKRDIQPASTTKAVTLQKDKTNPPALSATKAVPMENTIQEGILSTKPKSFFTKIQNDIDKEDWKKRCRKYGKNIGFRNDDQTRKNRRIFYGSLIGDEPWELFEIMGTETYGIFQAMVFVESNRTQMFHPRTLRHNEATRQKLQTIFGTPKLEIRQYVNEDNQLVGLTRENEQRHEILKAWKEMGMGPEDIGYISDVDETFSRGFLRAVQTCPYVAPFEYEKHKCHLKGARVKGRGQVYEGSPDCVTKDRRWDKPDMIIGACLEEIGNATEHPLAKRNGYKRMEGFATGHGDEEVGSEKYKKNYANITGDHYPLWSAGDLRMLGGGTQYKDTTFHLHNWFADFAKVRTKYNTYGHPVKKALTKPIHDIHTDLKLMTYCLRNLTDAPSRWQGDHAENKEEYTETQQYNRVVGGLLASPKPWPIYFQDEDYRKRKHEAGQAKLKEDQEERLKRLDPWEAEEEYLKENIQEVKRQVWRHDYLGKSEQAKHARELADQLVKELRLRRRTHRIEEVKKK